jgi:CRP-like cAMP-binding protein
LENNYNELFSRIDENQLLQELPITLRDEVFIHKYQGLLDSIDFLRECENNEFVWALVQLLRKIKVDKDDVVYWEGDFAEEIYFIKQGKIKLYSDNGLPFATYKDGQHFGDPEGKISNKVFQLSSKLLERTKLLHRQIVFSSLSIKMIWKS